MHHVDVIMVCKGLKIYTVSCIVYLENLDMIVIGAGTCGTLTGVARKIKERQPKCKVSGLYIKHDRDDVPTVPTTCMH